jgi:hypothetical protein
MILQGPVVPTEVKVDDQLFWENMSCLRKNSCLFE